MIFKTALKIPEVKLDKATHLGKTSCSTNIALANLPPIRSQQIISKKKEPPLALYVTRDDT